MKALPCPFCGSEPVCESWHGGPPSKVRVWCDSDDCHVGPSVTGDDLSIATERWNTRSVSTPTTDAVERVAKVLWERERRRFPAVEMLPWERLYSFRQEELRDDATELLTAMRGGE